MNKQIQSALEKQQDGTLKLSITIPKEEIKKTWDEIVAQMSAQAQVPGFRKGKAPKKIVEEKLDNDAVREEVLKKLLPKYYADAIQQHTLRPILNPKIAIAKDSLQDTEKDWKFDAYTCEAPEVTLGDYKAGIQKITAKKKIIIPGKNESSEVKLEEIMPELLKKVTVTIPGVLKEGEVDRLLSQMLDEVKSLGLTLDQYLSSTGKTPQNLREGYEKKVEQDIKLEFALQKIAEVEKITVDEKEIEEAIQKAKDEKEKTHLQQNKYLLASILRQQKTLDFLKNL